MNEQMCQKHVQSSKDYWFNGELSTYLISMNQIKTFADSKNEQNVSQSFNEIQLGS